MRHELHLLGRGLRWTSALVPLLVAVGWLSGGRSGLYSALIGAGIVVGNQVLAVASTAWSRTLDVTVAAAGYVGWVLRMAGVLAVLAVVGSASWIDRRALAISFCATLAVLLGAECISYVRKSYVPAWRMAR